MPIFAQGMGEILPECAASGNCSLCGFLIGFANIATWLLSIVGSVALLLFIIGGLVWLTAGGNQERVQRGRSILVNTIYGVIVVFLAWLLVNFIIGSLVGIPINPKLFGTTQPWYQYCEGESQYLPGTAPTSTPP